MNEKAINKIIDKFFSDNDIDCCAEMGSDFCYYYDSNIIDYSLIVVEKMDNWYMKFAKKNGLKTDCGIFILSLLHEVGHYMTTDDFSDEKINFFNKMKGLLHSDFVGSWLYFSMPDEKRATEWAIDFIDNNVDKVRKLAEDIQMELV